MKRILVTGAAGQIGSDLVPALRAKYGNENVVAAGHTTPLPAEIRSSGPHTSIDVGDPAELGRVLREHRVDTLYHLGSILSALAEKQRHLSWRVNFEGLHNVLEASVEHDLQCVVVPSSIAAFGPETPADDTPNDTIQKPTTSYGISKVFGELMGNYYHRALGLDVRGVRLPGIVSWTTEPTAGTTDYSVAIFYGAILEERYTCYLEPDTRLPMMYMPDAILALMQLAEAHGSALRHRADFNVGAMSFTPAELADSLRKRIPAFRMEYEVDPVRQAIADSWPNSLDDSAAREEWGWKPRYDMDAMVDDMLAHLKRKLRPD